jgi:hypothetical protein
VKHCFTQAAPESNAVDSARVAFSLVSVFWRSKRKKLAAEQPPASVVAKGNRFLLANS